MDDARIARIRDAYIPRRWTIGARRGLTPRQVRALNVGTTGIDWLTRTQRAALTVEQVRSLPNGQFKHVRPDQVPWLSSDQVRAISSAHAFGQWSDEARAALTARQVRALDVGVTGIALLTTRQRRALSIEQVRALPRDQFPLIPPTHVPFLDVEQIRSIPRIDRLERWSAEARAALTPEQVRALRAIRGLHDPDEWEAERASRTPRAGPQEARRPLPPAQRGGERASDDDEPAMGSWDGTEELRILDPLRPDTADRARRPDPSTRGPAPHAADPSSPFIALVEPSVGTDMPRDFGSHTFDEVFTDVGPVDEPTP